MRDAVGYCHRCPLHSDLCPTREGVQQPSKGLPGLLKGRETFSGISNYVYIECILRNLLYILQRPKQWSLVVLVTGIYICAAIEKYPNSF